MDKKIKLIDAIKEFFVFKGIDTCFCVTGGGAMHINDSFGHDTRIHTIYNHHEQASAIAAEGYARIAGKPAIVSVTSGPGATNAITGVAGAWLDSIPMIVISGQMKRETLISASNQNLRQLGFQEFNIIDSVSCMTKYAKLLDNSSLVIQEVVQAFDIMNEGRKGPIWLDIPIDVQSEFINIESNSGGFIFPTAPLIQTPGFSNSTILSIIIDKLLESARPVLLVGYEVRMDNCVDKFIKLAEHLSIPVVTEWNSHDIISDDHHLNCGRPGTIGNRAGNLVVQQSDFLLCVGCQLSIRQISYVWSNFAPKAFKVGVSVDYAELNKPTINFDLQINCSISRFIDQFFDLLVARNYQSPFLAWVNWASDLSDRYPVIQRKHYDDTRGLSVYGFFKILSDFLPAKSITILANGAACVAGLQTVLIKPNQRIYTNAGLSGMGYAICAAIGASCAQVDQSFPIVCVEGDGSIQMNLQELQTIFHNRLNIKLFWLNNDGYQSIKLTQKGMFNALEKGYCGADSSSGLSCPSAKKIANAYGIPYFSASSISELYSISSFLQSNGPSIMEIILNPDEEFEPKLQSRLNPDGTFSTPSLEDMSPFLSKDELSSALYKA